MRRFANKTVFKNILLVVALIFIAVVLKLAFPGEFPWILIGLVGILAVVNQAWLVDLKRHLARIESREKRSAELGNANHEILVQHTTKLDRINRKAVKNETTINNIAGSVGRMAPIVRQVSSNVIALSKDQDTVTSVPKPDKLIEDAVSDPVLDSILGFEGLNSIPSAKRGMPTFDVTAMVIADEFTAAAFRHEWHQVEPKRTNFMDLLETEKIDLLFVESAWEGNGGDWRYQLVGSMAPRNEIVTLIEECKRRGIPTAFWNKEDPPHFEDFLRTAKLFDYVFTTEEDCVPKYIEQLGHERVHVLPFAAQPYYHNPARISSIERAGKSVFGGMYFREKYPERRAQMDYLLPAAAEYGLDIYSRNTTEEKYRFPEEVQKFVRGSLTYDQMVAAYHAYEVVLNVNSVPNSKSMCARRIFEATACGAAVVSPDSPSLNTYFNSGEITSVSDQSNAKHKIRALVRSEEFRKQRVHRAQRNIWANHTYAHRVEKVLNVIGMGRGRSTGYSDSISVIITTNREVSLPYLVENLRRQSDVKFEVVLITHGFELPDWARVEIQKISHVTQLLVETAPVEDVLGKNLNRLVSMSTGSFIVRMDDDDWYGPNYIQDLVFAARYSGADLVGKAASYIYFEDRDATILTYESHEHRYTDFVRGATFAGPRETFEKFQFPELGKSEDSTVLKEIREGGGLIYSADSFNFVVNRFANKERHTWTASDDQLFATGRMVFRGNGQDQLAV
ncbi:glycosyltransferase [Corynebacterium sp. MSK105]|uniref:glycosyltransferase family protein n=1 Tax=unclassified Corynebacterium TaxID=2624378 RepID=UPI00254F0B75|nr:MULTISPECIES: glycosyltransferase [unclassified Corynebacterium]MDK8482249.1 glycosyltransferase [Corynebacterium sp. MSK074]MDK8689890.1 glycosyltransferase [Corynebacterium sp. MSK105]